VEIPAQSPVLGRGVTPGVTRAHGLTVELTEGPGHDPNMPDAGPYQRLGQGFAPDIAESLEWSLAVHPHGGLRNVDLHYNSHRGGLEARSLRRLAQRSQPIKSP